MTSDARARAQMMEALSRQGEDLPADLECRVDYLLTYAKSGGKLLDVGPILDWLEEHRARCRMTMAEIPMRDVQRWTIDPASGAISHETGEFFRVIGLKVESADLRENTSWCQPMVHQREMGILGILVQCRDGSDRYLLQAKAEPGNVGRVQISPTLQSTVSNLKRAHGGGKSLWASLFEDPTAGSVVYSRHQVEDGGRFYLKTNLNMIVRLPEGVDLAVPDYFRWITMAELKQLLQYENVVNVAVRSIISAVW